MPPISATPNQPRPLLMGAQACHVLVAGLYRSTLPPLVLLSPSTDARIIADAPREETIATYRQRFSEHKFLRDAVYVGDHFFRGKTGPARKFLEVGGLTGNVGGSNSYSFERFLG